MTSSKLKSIISVIISFFFVFLLIDSAFACGPFFSNYIYTPEDITSPFLFVDIDSFLDSNYEIISAGWCPQSLYPVYRDLVNNELTQSEKEQLRRYYKGNFYNIYEQLKEAIAVWKEARKSVMDEDVEIGIYKCEDYSCYSNCLPGAFLTAAKTLRERRRIYNAEELKIWIEGQDKVFSNCGTPKKTGIAPSFLTALIWGSVGSVNIQRFFSEAREFFLKIKEFLAGITAKIVRMFQSLFTRRPVKPEEEESVKISPKDLLKYDQEYQTASAYFYKGNFSEAEKRFRKISENLNHPWRPYAALALGRTYIRKGQFAQEGSQKEELRKAKVQFENILRDESLGSVHNGARSLLNFVNFRINPEERFKDAEEVLLTSHNPEEIVNNLEDFSLLFPSDISIPGREKTDKITEKYILEAGGDLSQWILVWKSSAENNLEFALEKYQQTKSLPWLLASLKLMTVNHPLREEIIRESLKIPKDSAGYLTANYLRLRLQIEAGGNREEIKKDIESLLNMVPEESVAAKNYFADLRMIVAGDLKEGLLFSLRRALAEVAPFGTFRVTDKVYYLIDGKVKQLFNDFLPLRKWAEIASINDIFPSEVIKQIRLITFVRAFLLDNFGTAGKMANLLSSSDPVLKEDLSDFLQATGYNEKKFAGALFILKYYRLNHLLDLRLDDILVGGLSVKQKDMYRRNWWCPRQDGYRPYDIGALKKFVSLEEIQESKSENEKIYKIIAPNYLSEIVINYAVKNLDDSRVPEALHLAVVAARSAACPDEKTSEFSQRAFRILHDNYPNNYWTKQTPYWY